MKSIGIAGTAKNTGKTTTLTAVMDILRQRGVALGLTSIGYDGEDTDNITGLPKPRITVCTGDIAAVAQKCLPASEARCAVLEDTGIQTALGHILIVRITEPGRLVLAGPNKRTELKSVLERIQAHGVQLCMVDGALNRMAPLVEVDGLILATGAARHTDIARLKNESGMILKLFSIAALPAWGRIHKSASVFTQQGYASLTDALRQADTLLVEGVIALEYLVRLTREENIAGKRLIFDDPIKLLLAGAPEDTYACVEVLRASGAEVGVARAICTLAVTINPYYPKLRYSGGDYSPAYVDKDALYLQVASSIQVPCYDVMRHGADGLAQAALDMLA